MKDNKELVFNLTYMRQMKTDRSVAISEREYVRGIEDDSKIRLSERNCK